MNRNNGRQIAVRLFLLRDYVVSNADRKHAVRTKQIQKYYYDKCFLSKDGTYLSVKTIYNDIAALVSLTGLEIQYSEKHKGYILQNPPFEAYELRLIVDSVQASKYITQTEAKKLTEKIQKHFGNARRAKIISPPEAVDGMCDFLQKASDMYKKRWEHLKRCSHLFV